MTGLTRAERLALIRQDLFSDEWALLSELLDVHPEPMTMSALADYLPVDSRSSLAGIIHQLHQRGLIEFPRQGFVVVTEIIGR